MAWASIQVFFLIEFQLKPSTKTEKYWVIKPLVGRVKYKDLMHGVVQTT
jgi:hypothetical protein